MIRRLAAALLLLAPVALLAAGPYYPAPNAKISLHKQTRVIYVGNSSAESDFMTLARAYSWLADQSRDATHQWVVIVDPDANITSPGSKPTYTSVVYRGNLPSTSAACASGQAPVYVAASNTWTCSSGPTVTLTPAAAGTNVAEVTITVKDAAGVTVAAVNHLDVWLSDASTCAGITGTTASGTVQAKSASGRDIVVYTAKKSLRVETLATGVYILEITDTAKTGFYVCATGANGKAVASAQLVAGNYGA